MTAAQTQLLNPIHAGVQCDVICKCPYHLHNYPWNKHKFQKSHFKISLEKVTSPSIKVIPGASDFTMMTLEKRRGTLPPTWNLIGAKRPFSGNNLVSRSLPFLKKKDLDNNLFNSCTKELQSDIPETKGHTQETFSSENSSASNLPASTNYSHNIACHSNKQSSGETSNVPIGFPESVPKGRVKDNEGFIRRAACVCVNEDESRVLLIGSKTDGKGWLIPGGGLEDGEEEEKAAIREAWEEAGVKGSIVRWLGVFQSEDELTHKKKRTSVFVLKVSDQANIFPESQLGRSRGWFLLDDAIENLSISKPNQIAYLHTLRPTY